MIEARSWNDKALENLAICRGLYRFGRSAQGVDQPFDKLNKQASDFDGSKRSIRLTQDVCIDPDSIRTYSYREDIKVTNWVLE